MKDGRNCVLGLGFYAAREKSQHQKLLMHDRRDWGLEAQRKRREAHGRLEDIKQNLQRFQSRFDIRKFEECCFVRDLFIVE